LIYKNLFSLKIIIIFKKFKNFKYSNDKKANRNTDICKVSSPCKRSWFKIHQGQACDSEWLHCFPPEPFLGETGKSQNSEKLGSQKKNGLKKSSWRHARSRASFSKREAWRSIRSYLSLGSWGASSLIFAPHFHYRKLRMARIHEKSGKTAKISSQSW